MAKILFAFFGVTSLSMLVLYLLAREAPLVDENHPWVEYDTPDGRSRTERRKEWVQGHFDAWEDEWKG